MLSFYLCMKNSHCLRSEQQNEADEACQWEEEKDGKDESRKLNDRLCWVKACFGHHTHWGNRVCKQKRRGGGGGLQRDNKHCTPTGKTETWRYDEGSDASTVLQFVLHVCRWVGAEKTMSPGVHHTPAWSFSNTQD